MEATQEIPKSVVDVAVEIPDEASVATPWDTVAAPVDAEPSQECHPEPCSAKDLAPIDEQLRCFGLPQDDGGAIVAVNPNGAGGGGGTLTIPLICIGIGLIAMCLIIPAADENRRLAYERDRLQADVEQLHRQVATNDAFLRRVGDDAGLAERLARRQLKMVPEGTMVLDLKSTPAHPEMSPFLLVTVPAPAPMPPYRPVAGFLADACRHPKTQLYLIGASLLMIASGLVLSRSSSFSASTVTKTDEFPTA